MLIDSSPRAFLVHKFQLAKGKTCQTAYCQVNLIGLKISRGIPWLHKEGIQMSVTGKDNLWKIVENWLIEMTLHCKMVPFHRYFSLDYQKILFCGMQIKLLSIDAEPGKDRLKGPEIRELDDTEKLLDRF